MDSDNNDSDDSQPAIGCYRVNMVQIFVTSDLSI